MKTIHIADITLREIGMVRSTARWSASGSAFSAITAEKR